MIVQVLYHPKLAHQGTFLLLAVNCSAPLVPQAHTLVQRVPPPAPPAALVSTVHFRQQLPPAAVPSTSTSRRTLKAAACPAPIRLCQKRLKPRAIRKIRLHRMNETPTPLVFVFSQPLLLSLAFLFLSSFGIRFQFPKIVPFTRPFACMFSCSHRMQRSKAAQFGFC